jgi:hypothetical protein
VQTTKEKESGSSLTWPTPNAWDGQRGPRSQKNLREKNHQINLITAVKDASSSNPVKIWPTPTQDMVSNRTKKYAQGGTPLTLAVNMWPTPRAKEPGRTTKGYGRGLKELVEGKQQMWPTPRAAIGMNMRLTENMAKLRHKKYLETEVAYQESAPGGQLNPTWVEWLMGYPTGWTVLNA